MQFQIREYDDSCQRPTRLSYPRVVVEEHLGAPLPGWSGVVIMRDLTNRLRVVSAIDVGLRILRRCKWYLASATRSGH